ncbi:uncharacterized protein ACRADG_008424 [Cochliomyia hominivorax]
MKITCRICKVQQGEFFTLDSIVPIYGEKEQKLLDIFNKCFQLNAQLQDNLPQVVCLICLDKQKEFFEFQLKAEKSDLEFRKTLKDTLTQKEIESQHFENENITVKEETPNSAEKDIKNELEEEVITTEDEFEEDEEEFSEAEGKTHIGNNEEEEDVEDTDILFELYNKNDSCLENYIKYKSETAEDIAIHCNEPNDLENKIIISEEEIVTDMHNSKTKSNKIILDVTLANNIDSNLNGNTTPIVDISRLNLPVQYPQVQTIVLEPLVEMRKWQCSDCGRKYITEEKLEQHRKLHKKSENCECEICGANLKTLFEYREHMKTHGTERKFSCEFCDKNFVSRANLKTHLYVHTNLRPFKCEICGKTFQQKSILKTHMTLHTGKPFECNLCQRRFSRTAHLNIHMRQHNNIRPYQCTQCPSSYMQKSHLDRHISSSHLGVRFQCTVCGKMYTKKPSLNTHMRDAHCKTVSLYNCEICDLDFAKQKGLYYHMKSKHPDYKKNQN